MNPEDCQLWRRNHVCVPANLTREQIEHQRETMRKIDEAGKGKGERT